MRTAWFASTKFHQAACFGKATFGNEVGFGNAIFVKEAGFGHAIFNGIAAFGEATFKGDADFGGAKFRQTAEFGATIYAKNAVFRSTVFSEEVDFGGAEFVGSVWFNGAAFNGFAYFQVATFGSTGKNQLANFIDCQLEKPTNFRDAVFNASYPDFAGTVLHERTSFTDHSENWPKASRNPARAKDSCAVIRHNLGKQGLPEAEHFFYRREMGFAGQSGPLWQRPPYWLFGWFSDYGYSILTPFLWLLLLIVLGAYVLAWGLAGGAQAVSFEQGLGLSFSNVFNFLGFHRTFVEADFTLKLPQWLKVVSAFQTIAGVVLLFFLGLGLRTRFRLR